MTRLFISDIDGCIGEPYHPLDMEGLAALRSLVDQTGSLEDAGAPAFSLCSGRPFPYVEAISQLLGVKVPVLFESGGGMFDPVSAEVSWYPGFNKEVKEQIEIVSQWLLRDAIPGSRLNFDYAKRTQAGVIGPDADEIKRMVSRVEAFVLQNCPDLGVFPTLLSIDILPESISKANGIRWLSKELDIPVEEMAYIGDSKGDVGALELVGSGFAPSNASSLAKDAAGTVTSEAGIQGVLTAYKSCFSDSINTATPTVA